MFNRTRSESAEGRSPAADAPASPAPQRPDPTLELDRMLTEMGAPAAERDRERARLATTEHADTLRATRDAQHRAQELFALAAQARSDATEQAELIIEEAQRAADGLRADAERESERTRNELSGWATAQRAHVEALVAEVLQTAHRDAEEIRADALRTAMTEAEETARIYVSEATARGAREAEAIRRQASDLLARASDVGTGIGATLQALMTSFDAVTAELGDQQVDLDRVLAEAAEEQSVPDVELPPTPTSILAARGAQDGARGDVRAEAPGAAAITDAIAYDRAPGTVAEPTPAAAEESTATDEDAAATSRTAAARERTLAPRPSTTPRGRELGSMFRQTDVEG